MFSMTMLVTLDEDQHPFEEVQAALASDGATLGMQIQLQRQDLFDFMHTI
jgi:ACT domain-containing protein